MAASRSAAGPGGAHVSTSSSSSQGKERPPRSHKVVFLGQPGSGKTSIIQQFMYRRFDESYQATVGIDFVSKVLCPEGARRPVKLQLWDTAGQERFRALIPGYLRDCSAALVVYDITSRPSFEAVQGWHKLVLEARGPGEAVTVL